MGEVRWGGLVGWWGEVGGFDMGFYLSWMLVRFIDKIGS